MSRKERKMSTAGSVRCTCRVVVYQKVGKFEEQVGFVNKGSKKSRARSVTAATRVSADVLSRISGRQISPSEINPYTF